MITIVLLFINSLRLVFGYSPIVKNYDGLFFLGMSEMLIAIVILIGVAMYTDLKN